VNPIPKADIRSSNVRRKYFDSEVSLNPFHSTDATRRDAMRQFCRVASDGVNWVLVGNRERTRSLSNFAGLGGSVL